MSDVDVTWYLSALYVVDYILTSFSYLSMFTLQQITVVMLPQTPIESASTLDTYAFRLLSSSDEGCSEDRFLYSCVGYTILSDYIGMVPCGDTAVDSNRVPHCIALSCRYPILLAGYLWSWMSGLSP